MPSWNPCAIVLLGSTMSVLISSVGHPGEDLVEVRSDGAVRPGGGERVAGAAAVVGEDLAARAARRGRGLDAGNAGDRADVCGDVLGVGAGDEVGGHVGGVGRVGLARMFDLVADDALDRVLVHAGRASVCEGRIEVGADVAAGAGLLEVVAGTALGDEEGAAVGDVGVLTRVAAAEADEHDRAERGQSGCLDSGSLHARNPTFPGRRPDARLTRARAHRLGLRRSAQTRMAWARPADGQRRERWGERWKYAKACRRSF